VVVKQAADNDLLLWLQLAVTAAIDLLRTSQDGQEEQRRGDHHHQKEKVVNTTATATTPSATFIKAITHLKEAGNAFFSDKAYEEALAAYDQGVNALLGGKEAEEVSGEWGVYL